MSEILLRIKDKVNDADFYKNTRVTKRGDVVVVRPDGWAWGKEELKNPDWRIVKLPGVTESEASVFLAEEFPQGPIDPLNPPKTLQRRGFKINLDDPRIPAAIRTYLADNTRATPAITLTKQQFNLDDLKVTKSPIEDPAIIGEPHGVIG